MPRSLSRMLPLLLVLVYIPAQTWAAGIWNDVNFEQSPEKVYRILSKQQFHRIESVRDDNLLIESYQGQWQNEAIQSIAYFYDRQLWQLVVLIPTQPGLSPLAVYDKYRSQLEVALGQPNQEIIEFQKPYKRGDGQTLKALSVGKARVESSWRRGAQNELVVIRCQVNGQGQVVLTWQKPQVIPDHEGD